MNEPTKQYTAFWPVLIVFTCFTITNTLNLIGNWETRGNLMTAVNQLAQGYNKAKAKEVALSGVAHDLMDLAPTSLVAQQIVTDFHIQLKNQQAGTSLAPSAPSAPVPAQAAPAPTNAAAGDNALKP